MRRTLRRARRLVRALIRPLRPVSGLGWALLGVGLPLLVGGWQLGWVEATVPGVGLVGAVLLAVVLTVGRSTYVVSLELASQRVVVGERVAGRIGVRSRARGRLLPARLELPVRGGAVAQQGAIDRAVRSQTVSEFPLPSLAPGEEHEELFAIPTLRRSVITVGPVRSVRGDPWGLVARRVAWTDAAQVYVHPKVVALTGAAAGVLRDLEGQSSHVVSDADMSFHALRDYVPGDDRRHIHWKTTARTGTLMVRQFEDTRRTHTAVALATHPDEYASADELELAVAVAASLGVQALRDERDLTFLAGPGRLHTRSPGRLLDDVAGLEASQQGRTGVGLVPWVQQLAPDASVAMLVTGSVPDRSALRVAAERLPAGVRTVLITCESGASSEVSLRGALSLVRVGALADLPRLLRQVVGAG